MAEMLVSESLQTIAVLVVPADPRMLSVCRMVLAGVVRGVPLADAAVDDLKLVLSEVAGNAISSSAGGHPITISFDASDAELRVAVSSANDRLGEDDVNRALGWLRELCDDLWLERNDGTESGTRVQFSYSLADA